MTLDRPPITHFSNQAEFLPLPPPPPFQPPSPLEENGRLDDESDNQPIFFSTTASSMPPPAFPFETPVIFNGYYNFVGQKILHGSPGTMRRSDCEKFFAGQSILFEKNMNSSTYDRNVTFARFMPTTVTSYRLFLGNEVQDFLNSLRDMGRNLDQLYKNGLQMFVNKCTEDICDMYRTSSTSTFGLLLKAYIKMKVEHQGEKNVLTVRLKRIRYHEMIHGNEDSQTQHENMSEWLYLKSVYTQTEEELQTLYRQLHGTIGNFAGLCDFNRLMAAIDRILSFAC